ncbi:MAG: hypothetical protein CMJ81_16025 [Planctomycetaceae bacterium]|nr:hypothetical protein [Planctomycetaceae bacterium]
MNFWPRRFGWVACCLVSTPLANVHADSNAVIDFQRDVRPILSDACFQCHGPGAEQRESELRLDNREGAFADLSGQPSIVPGDRSQSELYVRLTHADPDQRMPPVDKNRQLTSSEIELIGQWIDAGASWNDLWSLVAPQRPPLPDVQRSDWLRHPIDSFILSRLESLELTPSDKANKETLIRRLSLDLTGLPPTVGQIDDFLADSSPASYQRLVDRLMASPRYGERMAVQWLDGARYADTSGYQMDGPRQMWRWRNWVIEAFNSGMPYDQFTVEQCAGDLLPNPSLDQLIATGFHRNHRGNAEGGIISEEYRVEYVVDRLETTATVWLGLTLGCARCHEHKYDPISQREYYELFAFFNNVPERGKARKWGNSIPIIKAPTREQAEALAQLDRKIEQAEFHMEQHAAQLDRAQIAWEAEFKSTELQNSDQLLGQPVIQLTMDGAPSVTGSGANDLKPHWEGNATFREGRLGQAGHFDGTRYLEVGDAARFDYDDAFSISAWVYPEGGSGGTIVSKMQSDTDEQQGYSVELIDGHWHIHLVRRWLDDCLRVRSVDSFPANQWRHLLVTYDGSRVFQGARLYVDGNLVPLEIIVDDLQQPFLVPDPLRIGARGTKHRFHGLIDDVRLFAGQLSQEKARILATHRSIAQIIALPRAKRNENQSLKLRLYFTEFHGPQVIRAARRHWVALQHRRRQLQDAIGTVMVLQELETPRDTFVLNRGRYDAPGEQVQAGVPDCFPSLPDNAKPNRLAMARWLVDPNHPLTARVAVNRVWQLLFGQGLVRTGEDFGSQGEKPSHPQLLDWLAVELTQSEWDSKRLQRRIVSSATYQQSSRVSTDRLEADPENRWLGRGARYRMSAHMIRDHALAASGLLTQQLGGPSVKPYQPEGLWVELTLEESRYVQDRGPDLYRRSLYTYWKRTVAPPSMLVMDAAPRETCTVRTSRTNTPLQALNLMNDVTFVEASRALAERSLLEGGPDDAQRLTHAFRLVSSRRPNSRELQVLKSALQFHRQRYANEQDRAQTLIDSGDSKPDPSLNAVELAAHTLVMNMLLNLDEVITRE